MDAVKYLQEANRMCYSINYCIECPLEKEDLCVNSVLNGDEEKVVILVEQWSIEHTKITNMDKFKEIFGSISEVTAPPSWWTAEYKPPKEEE